MIASLASKKTSEDLLDYISLVRVDDNLSGLPLITVFKLWHDVYSLQLDLIHTWGGK